MSEWTPPPWEPPWAGDEIEHLVAALERLRATFRWKADGLDAGQLTQTFSASALSIGALLKHLAFVEDYQFTTKITGAEPGDPWPSDQRPSSDWSFTSAADHSPEELYDLWDSAVERSRRRLREALARGGLDQSVHLGWGGDRANLRRIMCDLLEEYGRHTGHADLIRESIDGRVGEDPEEDWRTRTFS
ncbi:MAG: hypothetical protein JWN31_1931 [Frankiales bacterium]|nr:hypothetical protein [Frankiales bacterium]